MTRWCQVVPFVAAATLLPGCFLFHGTGDPPPAPPPSGRDAGIPTPAADAGAPPMRRDAGAPIPPPPPPPGCSPHPIGVACTDTGNGAVPVGRPYDLPVAFGGPDECWCGESIACSGEVVAPGVVDLRSHLCAEILCDGCFPYVSGTCALPPLDEGTWHVLVNGRDAFDLRVSDAEPGVGPVEACVTPAGEEIFGCPLVWTPAPEPVDQICVPGTVAPRSAIPIAVTDFCLECGYTLGSCEVVRTANEIQVLPTSIAPSCDILCGAACTYTESRCYIPALEEGDYRVTVPGLPDAILLHVDEAVPPMPGVACLSVPED